jgi:hypothetical protein
LNQPSSILHGAMMISPRVGVLSAKAHSVGAICQS